jgi:hypothetical protein
MLCEWESRHPEGKMWLRLCESKSLRIIFGIKENQFREAVPSIQIINCMHINDGGCGICVGEQFNLHLKQENGDTTLMTLILVINQLNAQILVL